LDLRCRPRNQLEHAIRAAGQIIEAPAIVVGSQTIDEGRLLTAGTSAEPERPGAYLDRAPLIAPG